MVVVAKLKAVKGKEKEMEKALLDIIPKVREEEGTLVYTLHQDQNDPCVFLFYEKYKDVDALVAHSSTPHFKALFGTIKPLLEANPEIVMYNELAGI
ncbi:MAG: antibiotic biosynthesis monooxygenase [Desulfobacteraceae bacterium]|nr:antibiotic biosynthesis monooxygenase [Desulfobacteraceae bacterium]MBC2756019.1 antibiotic biosynthesis monooxygenase [Desulfobacteraceae bacterium]